MIRRPPYLSSRCRASKSALPATMPPLPSRFLLTLERSVASPSSDLALRHTGAFAAEIFPDLPIATTWGNLWKLAAWKPAAQASQPVSASNMDSSTDVRPAALKVMTVAANLRRMPQLQQRILALTHSSALHPPSSGSFDDSSKVVSMPRAADALLMVSGSHPVRGLPGISSLLHHSFDTLALGARLRASGQLPPMTQLWAVANPNSEADARLALRKVEAGAQVFVTQPPFDVQRFKAWVEDAASRGVWEHARLVVGHPMISSSSNLRFWLALSLCSQLPSCKGLLASFLEQEAKGTKPDMQAFCQRYNEQLLAEVLSWPCTSGLHVMPITARAKACTLEALREGGMLHSLRAQPPLS
ncbi:hypothetical protein V8C86DRAFT_2601575 [Haematococcus lacustris]